MVQTRSFIRHHSLLAIAALFIAATTGCGSDAPKPNEGTVKAKSDETSLSNAEQCRRKLSAAMSRLAAERVASAADADRGVSGLNSWVASCGATEITEAKLDDAAMKRLNNNPRVTAQRFTGSDGFYVRDCLLLRDLSDEIISGIEFNEEDSSREAARVIAIFQWINRHVSLTEDNETTLPLNLFDVLMLGRGTAEHRAWLFAELLRQQQIDAVWVTTSAAKVTSETESVAGSENGPADAAVNDESDASSEDKAEPDVTEVAATEPAESEPSTQSAPPSTQSDANPIASQLLNNSSAMVVVFHEGGAWLFDCYAGITVPATRDFNPIAPRPADLQLLLAHPRWQSAEVHLIAQASTFAPRMLILQDNLASSDAAVLYEELNGSASDIRPLLQRIEEGSGGAWKAAEISVWSFPEEVAVASHALTEAQQRQFDQTMQFFDAPFERAVIRVGGGDFDGFDTDELTEEERQKIAEEKMRQNFERLMDPEVATSEDRFGKPSKKLLKARIQQISGDISTSVIQQLQQVRIAGMETGVRVAVPKDYQDKFGLPPVIELPLPSLIKSVNESSTGNSIYWAAMCQFERDEVGSALITLANYRRQLPEGQWRYPSMINEAMGHLIRNKKDRAIKTLKLANQDDNPEQLRVQLLLKALQQ